MATLNTGKHHCIRTKNEFPPQLLAMGYGSMIPLGYELIVPRHTQDSGLSPLGEQLFSSLERFRPAYDRLAEKAQALYASFPH